MSAKKKSLKEMMILNAFQDIFYIALFKKSNSYSDINYERP